MCQTKVAWCTEIRLSMLISISLGTETQAKSLTWAQNNFTLGKISRIGGSSLILLIIRSTNERVRKYIMVLEDNWKRWIPATMKEISCDRTLSRRVILKQLWTSTIWSRPQIRFSGALKIGLPRYSKMNPCSEVQLCLINSKMTWTSRRENKFQIWCSEELKQLTKIQGPLGITEHMPPLVWKNRWHDKMIWSSHCSMTRDIRVP